MKKVGANNSGLKVLGDPNALNVVCSLMADTVMGVTFYKEDLSDFREFYQAIDGEDFYNNLPDCGQDQVIVCHNVSEEWRHRIEEEYGITKV